MRAKKVKRNINQLEAQVNRHASFLDSLPTRFSVWKDACGDGWHSRYGMPEHFRMQLSNGKDSESVDRIRQQANVAAAKVEQLLESESVRYNEMLPKVRERLAKVEAKITALKALAGHTLCHDPGVKPLHYKLLLLLFIIAEGAFSLSSLSFSGIGSYQVVLIIAAVATAVIVVLCHYLGQALRKLPLADGGTRMHWAMHLLMTFMLAMMLLSALLTIGYFRWKGLAEVRGDAATLDTSTVALFVLGMTFAFAAVIAAYETEYSGPRFGLGSLEREQMDLRDLVAAIETALEHLNQIRKNFGTLLTTRVAALRAAHLRRYVKSWRPVKAVAIVG